ncbi:hypothetical protein Tco_0891463 [Tanacetum coccineum]|uniref:Uncharacterized protein n=1 Tax=Tanacetum coccineum TaxID=301880 RepID=A0ABQ5C6C5_9ASTR
MMTLGMDEVTAEVIEPYTGDDLNNPPPPVSEDEETPPTSPVIPDANGCDNIEIDRTVRKVMSDVSGVKKLVKDLSDRFDEYERSRVFKDKKILEEELCQQSEDGFPVPSGSQVRKPPAEPFARSAPVLRFDDPYVVAKMLLPRVTPQTV